MIEYDSYKVMFFIFFRLYFLMFFIFIILLNIFLMKNNYSYKKILLLIGLSFKNPALVNNFIP